MPRYGHPASGLGNDGRRKRLKLRSQSFKLLLPEAARPLPILHRVLVLPKKSFNEFIRQQFQALGFASFCQEKEDSPSAASRGKPAQRKKALSACRQLFP